MLHIDQYTFLIVSLSILRMKNISDKSGRETQNTPFAFSSWKSWHFCDNVEEYSRTREATDNNMMHSHVTLDT